MPAQTLNFTLAEYESRLRKTREAMQAKGIDTLVVIDPSNMNWLTGYDGWSFYTHQCVVVPLTGDIFWYGRENGCGGCCAHGLPARHAGLLLSRHLRPDARSAPDGASGPHDGRSQSGRRAYRYRARQLLLHRRRRRGVEKRIAGCALGRCDQSGQLAARGEKRHRTRLHAQSRQDRRRHASPDIRGRRARFAQKRAGRRDLSHRDPRRRRDRRRLCGGRAVAAVGRSGGRTASDMGRRADEKRRRHVFRNRRLL